MQRLHKDLLVAAALAGLLPFTVSITAAQETLDRTVLPIQEPPRPTYSELDARNVPEGIAEVARYVFSDSLETPIVKHELGDSAGVIGAALVGV